MDKQARKHWGRSLLSVVCCHSFTLFISVLVSVSVLSSLGSSEEEEEEEGVLCDFVFVLLFFSFRNTYMSYLIYLALSLSLSFLLVYLSKYLMYLNQLIRQPGN